MVVVLGESQPVARKEHTCELCWGTIGADPDHPMLIVDASALMAEGDLGPREWWLYPEPDDEWVHDHSGTKAKLGEALWGIACCYEPASPEQEKNDG